MHIVDVSRDLLVEASKDFGVFNQEFMGFKDSQWFHKEWAEIFDSKERSLIEAPRGFGKSTTLGSSYSIWKCLFNRDMRFLIVSKTLSQSKDIISKTKRLIKKNDFLKNQLITGKKEDWKTQHLIFNTGCDIVCRPYKDSILGWHGHRVLCDEASVYDNHDIFHNYVAPTTNKFNGHICLIGTPQDELDLMATLKSNTDYFYKSYPAEHNKECVKSNGILWPTDFGEKKLRAIEERDGALSYAKNYLLKFMDIGSQLFPAEHLQKLLNPKFVFEDCNDGSHDYYVGVDLASSEKGDFTVYSAGKKIELDGLEYIQLVYMHSERGTHYADHKTNLRDVYEAFEPQIGLVDESLFGVTLIEDIEDEYGIQYYGYKFSPWSKLIDLVNVAVRMMPTTDRPYGKIIIPRGQDMMTHSETDVLLKELKGWIKTKTDKGTRTYKSTTKHDDRSISFMLMLEAASREQGMELFADHADIGHSKRTLYDSLDISEFEMPDISLF